MNFILATNRKESEMLIQSCKNLVLNGFADHLHTMCHINLVLLDGLLESLFSKRVFTSENLLL